MMIRMMATVSSIEMVHRRRSPGGTTAGSAARLALALLLACPAMVSGQESTPAPPPASRVQQGALFVAGGALGLAAHEAGHLLFDAIFEADPHLTRVDFHGIPFFAITPRAPLSPREALVVTSAGFWVQHATSEWLLTSRPGLRHESAPLAKGLLAFNVLASVAYGGAALGRTGPMERDTRGIASAARIDERWVGVLVLTPAVFDAIRYFEPDARWAVWVSRAAKLGLVLLLFRP